MYLRVGVFSLGLLLLSRIMGLSRESVQAAAFGSTGLGDVVIVMFTLPDFLVSVFLSGALAYVLLPYWAQQSAADQQASLKKITTVLVLTGVLLGCGLWLLRDLLAHALAPGLSGEIEALSATSLLWSAIVLPLAMLAALWTTRLQHARDFVGMYSANLVVNAVLIVALLWAAGRARDLQGTTGLGVFLVLAMLARVGWLYARLQRSLPLSQAAQAQTNGSNTVDAVASLPPARAWIWAALSSGLLLLLPLVGRSLASQGGPGSLANFNYAWKLVELPLVLAVQLVATLALPAIAQAGAGTPEREQALKVAFSLAWALACVAVSIVATFSLPLVGVLFGWGHMRYESLQTIAEWSAIGIWSLLPQAMIAMLLTTLAISQRMHVAAWAYVVGLAVLLLIALGGRPDMVKGHAVMWMLNGVLVGVAVVLMIAERSTLRLAFAWASGLVPLVVSVVLVSLKPLVHGQGVYFTIIASCVYAALVLGSALLATPLLRNQLGMHMWRKRRKSLEEV